MKQIKFKFTILMLVLGFAILFSGCIDEPNADIPIEQNSLTTASNESIQVSKLENKIDSMQQQLDDLQNRIDRVDLLKPSEKQLIPRLPFKVEIYTANWQTPLTYTFRENGLVELGNGNDIEYATYKLFRNNNTIKFSSPKYEFYGLIFYDNYAASIYENGWIGWVYNYKIIPPKYNSIRQMYELN